MLFLLLSGLASSVAFASVSENIKRPIRVGDIEELQEMVKQKQLEVNTCWDGPDISPLFLAIQYDWSLNAPIWLLLNGADPDFCLDSEGNTALLYMMQVAPPVLNLDVLRLMLEKGADVQARNNKGENAFMIACKNASIKGLRLLAENGALTGMTEADKQTALQNSAHNVFAKTDNIRALFD